MNMFARNQHWFREMGLQSEVGSFTTAAFSDKIKEDCVCMQVYKNYTFLNFVCLN